MPYGCCRRGACTPCRLAWLRTLLPSSGANSVLRFSYARYRLTDNTTGRGCRPATVPLTMRLFRHIICDKGGAAFVTAFVKTPPRTHYAVGTSGEPSTNTSIFPHYYVPVRTYRSYIGVRGVYLDEHLDISALRTSSYVPVLYRC